MVYSEVAHGNKHFDILIKHSPVSEPQVSSVAIVNRLVII